MRVVSVNVSAGRSVPWRGRLVHTGIFKEPVDGRVRVTSMGIDGDRQSDLSVHGGIWKAVYAYALEHYDWWYQTLKRDVDPGMFGENLTIQNFPEDRIAIGDVFQVGTARLQAVQPRLPCYKLGIRFGTQRILKQFMQSGRFGIYFQVLEEGEVGSGDHMTCTHRDPARVPVPALVQLLKPATYDPALLELALSVRALPPEWVSTLRKRRNLESYG